jgi:myo-inositol-1(or 4)-monophosphatase
VTDHQLLAGMEQAARAAGALLVAASRPAPATTMPKFLDTFHAAESPAADLLSRHLEALLPGVAWADEFDDSPVGDTWLVDVMDGAVQYLRGLPHWCVSVTLVHAGQPVAAVLHHPELDATVRAGEAEATRDGTDLRPSVITDPGVALLATSSPPGVARDPQAVRRAGESLAAVLGVAGAVRNLGPTSWQIADVAGGRLDGFWEYGRDAGNLLGAALVARQAGAVVTDAAGAPWTAAADSIVVGAPGLHGSLLDALADIR